MKNCQNTLEEQCYDSKLTKKNKSIQYLAKSGFLDVKNECQNSIELENNIIPLSEPLKIKNKSSFQNIKNIYKQYQKVIELILSLIFTIILPILISPILIGKENQKATEAILTISIPLAMFLGMAIGGNDICNSMGASYGSKTLTMRQAIILGCIFESLGAILLGKNVAKTIGTSIIDPLQYQENQILFIVSMTTILGAAAFSSLCVTIYGLPVSITQGIIFSMATVGIISVGWDGVKQQQVANILIALFSSPVVGVVISFLIYLLIINLIKKKQNPLKASNRYLPIFGFLSVYIVVFLVFYKGIELEPIWLGNIISLSIGALTGLILHVYNMKQNTCYLEKDSQHCPNSEEIEKDTFIQLDIKSQNIFRPLLIISACCVSFTHGANDIGNCIGPLSIIYGYYKNDELEENINIPFFTLILGAIAFSIGIILVGKRTIKTFGSGLSSIDPMKGFAVQFGTSGAILISTLIGMPVSTSHCAIGSILGSTMAEFISKEPYQFSINQLKKIIASWIYTIPFVCIISVLFFYALKAIYIEV
ncbi:hypothetical protein PPERSA_08528 [Pseudocohnilembus persalinus]|uniref:Phosphate transporter n=1 Tax=Pseudocohnilembus persalinus TaxID=266149 RepID=A0A0V0R6J0_PSEPJ|nr:hypothetical protein PPERSA_08528 [Pseudocohnilembus persalinus]|eukprot:KRX10125.1 hypothetical protein PPERSA_08528 [Pseudocohnilembus persalinus]